MAHPLVQPTAAPAAPRYLSDEALLILPAIEFAMAQVVAHLGPSRRAWRVDPAFGGVMLQADRRAVNQVLVSVLTGAASATRDGDWIELSLQREEGWLCLIVQDEGTGLPVNQNEANPEESRGIGLRLTLARSLMRAHGGSLTVQSAECVGTRVNLRFPDTRLIAPGTRSLAGEAAGQD